MAIKECISAIKTAGKNSRKKKRDLGWSLKKYPKKDKRGSI
jgi:hypothetical protein